MGVGESQPGPPEPQTQCSAYSAVGCLPSLKSPHLCCCDTSFWNSLVTDTHCLKSLQPSGDLGLVSAYKVSGDLGE